MLSGGISEISGSKGSSKTTFILNLTKYRKILFFTSKKFPYQILNKIYNNQKCKLVNCPSCHDFEQIYIKSVYDIEMLILLVDNIEPFIMYNSIEILIVDTFDSLLIIYEKSKEYYKNIAYVLNQLKRISFKYRVKIYILNEFVYTTNEDVISYKLGFTWNYFLNERIHIEKQNNRYKLKYKSYIEREVYEKEYTIDNGIVNYL